MTPPRQPSSSAAGRQGSSPPAHLAGAGVRTTVLEAAAAARRPRVVRARSGRLRPQRGPARALHRRPGACASSRRSASSRTGWNPVALSRSFFMPRAAGRAQRRAAPRRSASGSPRVLARRRRPTASHELTVTRVARPRPSADEGAPGSPRRSCASRRFVADHDALSADVARDAAQDRRVARRALPARRLAVAGRRASPPQAERRGAVDPHARRRPRAARRPAAGPWPSTTRRCAPTPSSSPPAGRPTSPSSLGDRAPAAPGPAAEVSRRSTSASSGCRSGRDVRARRRPADVPLRATRPPGRPADDADEPDRRLRRAAARRRSRRVADTVHARLARRA